MKNDEKSRSLKSGFKKRVPVLVVVVVFCVFSIPAPVHAECPTFNYTCLPPDPPPVMELLCSDDVDLWGNVTGNSCDPYAPPGSGPVLFERLLYLPSTTEVFGTLEIYNPTGSEQDVHAFAVAEPNKIGVFSMRDPNWDAEIVTRNDWDTGVFTFPNSGFSAAPNTIGTFDTFFGQQFSQVMVYWAIVGSDAVGMPIISGEYDGRFFNGPADLPLAPSPFVMFSGDGSVVATGMTIDISCQYFLVGDLNDDCKVDFLDIAQMANNWLVDCIHLPPGPPFPDPKCGPRL